MSSKKWIVLLALLLLGSNAYWLIHVIDGGISYTYLESDRDLAESSAIAVTALANLNLIGLSKDEALAKIESLEKETPFYKSVDSCIYLAQICVKIDSTGMVS
ncbi:Uncharacterised protein [Halioglobus japonicus]|nr:Uncharacterised protein [Halioglobus japonicus]